MHRNPIYDIYLPSGRLMTMEEEMYCSGILIGEGEERTKANILRVFSEYCQDEEEYENSVDK